MKEKIALVTIRYGENINGGAEYHCRMLAERLTDDYDVEVLTTCACNYKTGNNELPEGEEMLNGVRVRRFKVAPINRERHELFYKEGKPARKWRRFLFRIHLLKYVASLHPVWKCRRRVETSYFLSYPFYSPDIWAYVRENKSHYKVFIPINMSEPTTFFTAIAAPEKTILIPTMHNQSVFFTAILTEMMTRVAYIGFNTEAEQKLAENVYGKHLSPHGIISVGIETTAPASWQEVQAKYKLPENYLLYIGRVDSIKLGKLFEYFVAYKDKHPLSSLVLVLMGGVNYDKVPLEREDVIYTGFVSEAEKTAILQHAKVVVNPSKFESLSLMLLEAMNQEKPVLVNGKCNVLKEHCVKSGYAALYYTGKKTFVSQLHKLDTREVLRVEMGKKAKQYVATNYDWATIMRRLKNCIEKFH